MPGGPGGNVPAHLRQETVIPRNVGRFFLEEGPVFGHTETENALRALAIWKTAGEWASARPRRGEPGGSRRVVSGQPTALCPGGNGELSQCVIATGSVSERWPLRCVPRPPSLAARTAAARGAVSAATTRPARAASAASTASAARSPRTASAPLRPRASAPTSAAAAAARAAAPAAIAARPAAVSAATT